MLKNLLIVIALFASQAYAQDKPIKIKEETPNASRLELYAHNESEVDYDILLKVSGTNIRQSSAKPRLMRVPSATKVLVKTLIVPRGKTPNYTYDLTINDSLSKRALKKPATPIKLQPKKRILIYLPVNCTSCDSLISQLSNSKYLFRSLDLKEKPELAAQLSTFLAGTKISIDELTEPLISLGGRIFTEFHDFDTLLEELGK